MSAAPTEEFDDDLNLVCIHVCDESRNMEKTFNCDKDLLLRSMQYFQKYLSGDDWSEEVDISVHCDILVFDWLMQYIGRKVANTSTAFEADDETTDGGDEASKPLPKLEIHNVVSILISSYFLEMHNLVGECIEFVSKHMNDIISLPLDLSCLNETIIKKLACSLSLDTLDIINDPNDKLVSRLYKRKLRSLLLPKRNQLFYCVYCHHLFTSGQRKKIVCNRAPIRIDFHGSTIARHCAHPSFDIQKYLLGLRIERFDWRRIYWHIWGLLQSPMFCSKCQSYFTVSHLNHCAYHSISIQPTKLNYIQNNCQIIGFNSQYYPCCNMDESLFHPSQNVAVGCTARRHSFDKKSGFLAATMDILTIVDKRSDMIVIPFANCNLCGNDPRRVSYFNDNRASNASKHSFRHTLGSKQSSSSPKSQSHIVNGSAKDSLVWDPKFYIFGLSLNRSVLSNLGDSTVSRKIPSTQYVQSKTSKRSVMPAQSHHYNRSDFISFSRVPKFWSEYAKAEAHSGGKKIGKKSETESGDDDESFEYLSYLLVHCNDAESGDDTLPSNDETSHAGLYDEATENGGFDDAFLEAIQTELEGDEDSDNTDTKSIHTIESFRNSLLGLNINSSSNDGNLKTRSARLGRLKLKETIPSINKSEKELKRSSFDIHQNDRKKMEALVKSLSEKS